MTSRLRVWALALGFLASGLAPAGAALADSAALRGWTLVAAKDVEARTVTLDGVVYGVTNHTRIEDRDGIAIKLEDLRAGEPGAAMLDPRQVDGVYFQAYELRGELVLDQLKVLRVMPR